MESISFPLLFGVMAVAWVIRLVERTLFHVALWQRKEYRWDRMRAHLQTREGLWMALHPWAVVSAFILLMYLLIPLQHVFGDDNAIAHPYDETIGKFFFAFLIVYVFASCAAAVVHGFRRGIVRPQWTAKALLLTACTIAGMLALWLYVWLPTYLELRTTPPVVSDLPDLRIIFLYFGMLVPYPLLVLLPTVVAFLVTIVTFFSRALQRRTIARAKAIMRTHLEVTVVGITGSYGKSSTKEFLAHILEQKFAVIKTPKNNNTAIGVAKTVLREIQSRSFPPLIRGRVGGGSESDKPHPNPPLEREGEKPTVFVVEMGAYTKGEIKGICDIVHPKIGILTAVSQQHLSIFGKTISDVQAAKRELIDALPDDGIAIMNMDNRWVREIVEKTNKKFIGYSLERPTSVRADAVTVQPEKVSFSVVVKNISPLFKGEREGVTPSENNHPQPLLEKEGGVGRQHITAPLAGAQHVSNLLAAIGAAHVLGMTLPEIADAVKTVTPPEHTMRIVHHTSGAIIIDDAYSANPDGVIAALEHLKRIPKKKKILVMMPMIELGRVAKDEHRRVGEMIGAVCDAVYWAKKDYADLIRDAAVRKGMGTEAFHVITNPKELLTAVKTHLNKDAAILFENRIPSMITAALLEKEPKK